MIKLNRPQLALSYAVLLLYSAVTAVPLFVMLFNGFKDMRGIFLEPFSVPWPLKFDNYIEAWTKGEFSTYMMNSIIISAVSVAAIVLISSMAAYILARYTFPLRRFLHLYFLTGLVLPARLAIIPLFLLMRDLHLLDTRLSLVLVYTAAGLPFSIFLLVNFFRTIPVEIEESARMDGARPFQIYWHIMLPLLRPALATVAVFNFVTVWNDFFFPLIFIQSDSKATIPLGITNFFGEYSIQWDLLFAGLNIAVLPIIVLFILASRLFVSGMTQGAVK
jgi:raffinose/stachyose/melibiose transport system permease protein